MIKYTSKEQILERLHELPTLPTLYQKLVEVMRNSKSTTQDIAKIISSDQVAGSKVLRVANSPIFGLSGRITNISDAVMHLGFIEIRNILLAISIMNIIKVNKKFPQFKPVDFWKHTMAVGVIARYIGKNLKIDKIEDVFLAGVMHDIGKLFLITEFSDEYQKVFNLLENTEEKICKTEIQVFGFDHAEIGSWILEKWQQPKSIVDATKYHESGFKDDKLDLTVAIIYVANIYARKLKLGNPGDNIEPEVNNKICNFLNLNETFLEENREEIEESYQELISAIFN